jgi:hypothetical protein
MKLTKVNRLVLSGLLALSVSGGTLVPFVAGHASADPGENCVKMGAGTRPICDTF